MARFGIDRLRGLAGFDFEPFADDCWKWYRALALVHEALASKTPSYYFPNADVYFNPSDTFLCDLQECVALDARRYLPALRQIASARGYPILGIKRAEARLQKEQQTYPPMPDSAANFEDFLRLAETNLKRGCYARFASIYVMGDQGEGINLATCIVLMPNTSRATKWKESPLALEELRAVTGFVSPSRVKSLLFGIRDGLVRKDDLPPGSPEHIRFSAPGHDPSAYTLHPPLRVPAGYEVPFATDIKHLSVVF